VLAHTHSHDCLSTQTGTAFLAVETATGTQYCVKRIDKLQDTSGRARRWQDLECLKSEIDIMTRVSAIGHRNIIRFKQYFEVRIGTAQMPRWPVGTPHFHCVSHTLLVDRARLSRVCVCEQDARYVYIVMECAFGGELYDRIVARHRYSEKDAQLVIRQMMESVRAVHQLDIVHADIKPVRITCRALPVPCRHMRLMPCMLCVYLDQDNFLFTNRAEDADLKMIDFGHSQRIRPRELLHRVSGTPFYMCVRIRLIECCVLFCQSDTGGFVCSWWHTGVHNKWNCNITRRAMYGRSVL
jgi:serine/threonine protein kinase